MKILQEKRFALIGAGNIGRILLDRLLAAGVSPQNLAVYDIDPVRARRAAERFSALPITLADESTCEADVFLITTPPKAVTGILGEISNRLRAGQLVISFAAAVPLEKLQAALPEGVFVARVMPNAPSLVGQGMNPVVYCSSMTPDSREIVREFLAILGESVEVQDNQMNSCVGLSGAAMRSLLPALEGMTQAGVEAGLQEEDSRRIASQVMLGTAALALHTDLSFDEIKALTPMQTVDEEAVSQVFLVAARDAQEKMEHFQMKLMGT